MLNPRLFAGISCVVTVACGGRVTGTDPTSTSGTGGQTQVVGSGGSGLSFGAGASGPSFAGAPSVGTGGSSSTGGSTGACPSTDPGSLEPSAAGNPWVTSVFSFGDADSAPITADDPASTLCLRSPSPGVVCLSGVVADAGVDYHRWGTGFGFGVTQVRNLESVPFDATRANITGVRFTLQNQAPFGARAMLSLVDDPATADIVEYNYAFFVGGLTTAQYSSPSFDGMEYTGSVADETVRFDQFGKPEWDTTTFPFDPTRLNAFEFQVVSAQGASAPYDICVSDFVFVDPNGNVVEP